MENEHAEFFFKRPWVFRLFQNLSGAESMRRELAQRHIRSTADMRILDIGCGTGDILEHLPCREYVGFDGSADYIATAIRRYGSKGKFFHGLIDEKVQIDAGSFDRVLAVGVIHHLADEEVEALLKLARRALKPGGVFVSADNCFVEGQSPIANFISAHDRGGYVRYPEAYAALARRWFDRVETGVRHSTWPFPYSRCIIEATRNSQPSSA